ncbi:four-carbon acid sugar kinase family protein [Pseudonocardia sp. C8]|uniref:four-carbon acid sugar kinase family protein n=1 Tax=Pseudonocardia sp. C8 TaxID=2762759 RepID=UPI0016432726|nr:four-carbon acid sugar kinase family protein [Pseudonocardia sp. C8]MBC3192150.1 four-carbon acid sugar kinase family protein [Pseudonocardia sp. C8]
MASFGFVADDLTGASDILAQAHRYGLDGALVIGDAPLPVDVDVVGIAGPARSLGGAAFDDAVRRDLARIAEIDLDVLLYKVCSTFDSSPTIGSIGRGIELLHERFGDHGPIPVAPAQPAFGRFTAFSDHYAAFAGQVHRLDRHPVMSRHPSTPMHEADLRRVLTEQLSGGATVDAIHLPAYDTGAFTDLWTDRRQAPDLTAFVVDAVGEQHMDELARALRDTGNDARPALIVGSGGIMAALARTASGEPPRTPGPQRTSGPVLAVSASASSVTADQLDDAIKHGWVDVPVAVGLLHGPDDALVAALDEQVSAALSAGHDVVVHATRGTSDPRYTAAGPVDPAHLGSLIGALAGRMATAGLTRDVAVFGGDTSSHALSAMGVRELRVSDQFVTAGPICRTDDHAAVAGCRLLLKGGQVGPPDILRRFAGQANHP